MAKTRVFELWASTLHGELEFPLHHLCCSSWNRILTQYPRASNIYNTGADFHYSKRGGEITFHGRQRLSFGAGPSAAWTLRMLMYSA